MIIRTKDFALLTWNNNVGGRKYNLQGNMKYFIGHLLVGFIDDLLVFWGRQKYNRLVGWGYQLSEFSIVEWRVDIFIDRELMPQCDQQKPGRTESDQVIIAGNPCWHRSLQGRPSHCSQNYNFSLSICSATVRAYCSAPKLVAQGQGCKHWRIGVKCWRAEL